MLHVFPAVKRKGVHCQHLDMLVQADDFACLRLTAILPFANACRALERVRAYPTTLVPPLKTEF
jgi:hypothetical protein